MTETNKNQGSQNQNTQRDHKPGEALDRERQRQDGHPERDGQSGSTSGNDVGSTHARDGKQVGGDLDSAQKK